MTLSALPGSIAAHAQHDVTEHQTNNTKDQDPASESSVLSIGLEQVDLQDLEELSDQDGTTQQILQIFDQLNDSAEGAQPGWFSPAARRHQFKPCPRCQDVILDI